MFKRILGLAITSALVSLTMFAPCSCSTKEDTNNSDPTDSRATRTERLGEKLSADEYDLIANGAHVGPALAVQVVLANPRSFVDENPLRIEGEISSVCPKKGCWIRIGSADDNIFVKFAAGCDEYVALDAAGRLARVEGDLVIEEVGVEDLKHMLEDEGKTEEAAKVIVPETRTRFVATGATIRKR